MNAALERKVSKGDRRLLSIMILGFLSGIYFSFLKEVINIKIMLIISIIGIISGIIALLFDDNYKHQFFYILYIFFFLGILYNLYYNKNTYQEAIRLSGTSKNIIFQIKSRTPSTYNNYSYEAKILGFEKNQNSKHLLVKIFSSEKFNLGDVVFSKVKFTLPTNHSDFDYRFYLASKGYFLQGNILKDEKAYVIEALKNSNLLNNLRQYLTDSYFQNLDKESASIALAMSVGDRSFLSASNKSSLGSSGLMHIISISGSHFSILTDFLSGGLRNLGIKRKIVAIISIAFSLFYLLLVGLEPAVLRSAIMSILFFIAIILERSYDRLTALSVAGLISSMINPYMIISASFILSYLSIIGIFYLSPIIRKKLYSLYQKQISEVPPKNIVKYILEGLSITLGVNILLLPFNIYYFNKISLVAPITNLLTEPLIPIILLFSVLLPIARVSKINFLLYLISGILSLFTKLFIIISDLFSRLFFCEITINLKRFFFVLTMIIATYALYLIINNRLIKKVVVIIFVTVIFFSVGFYRINENNKTFFYSVSSSSSSSFVLSNKKDVVVVLNNSSLFDGGSINDFLEKSGQKIISTLVICDEDDGTIASAADIIEKLQVENIIVKSGVLKDYTGVKLMPFTPSNIEINGNIIIKIIENSVYVKLNNFSVAIYEDGKIQDYTNIVYLNNSNITEEDFINIKTDLFIKKPRYKTDIHEIIPNIYDEITLVWQNNKERWRELY